MKQLLYNNCFSFRQLKYGESHMTYLARNRVKYIDEFKASFKMFFLGTWNLLYSASENTDLKNLMTEPL